jgi:5-methylcytosine-specific restriction enzyme A
VALTPCLDCDQLTTSRRRRCPPCQAVLERRKRRRRPVSNAERDRRARTVANHVHLHGYVCPGCPLSAWHPHVADPWDNPLTADHVVPVAAGGPEDGPLRVMCRRGNSSKGKGRKREAL